tara:strand:+ start:1852 stop:2130 length:279 start_codon:yes stop_codon:yes gene_type:complete
MTSITLSDGRIKHTTSGWTGYQNPNEPMTKTKWLKDDAKYWEFEASDRSKKAGFLKWIVQLSNDRLTCDCGGFRFRKHCKHITQVKEMLNGN